jgi:hypothetical protein
MSSTKLLANYFQTFLTYLIVDKSAHTARSLRTVILRICVAFTHYILAMGPFCTRECNHLYIASATLVKCKTSCLVIARSQQTPALVSRCLILYAFEVLGKSRTYIILA